MPATMIRDIADVLHIVKAYRSAWLNQWPIQWERKRWEALLPIMRGSMHSAVFMTLAQVE